MTEKTTGGVHWSFWVIAAVALIWNLMGSANFFMQMNLLCFLMKAIGSRAEIVAKLDNKFS